ncbi:velvet factor-domain-containing protein [Roridomyces roridus]|uniref:Velvet factor-domain-containing protein n=1 Tax=Roridomyces roridus TaxID=1738132 RepID=A0AAD7C007_9AGAR|nr:velvet factor-domain-containing protein [Roridomyces roridus]
MHSLAGWNPDPGLSRGESSLQLSESSHERQPQVLRPFPPIELASGQFVGLTIRAELQEIQRPFLIFSCRFGAVDRRVLDDPPVAMLRLFVVHNLGTDIECEIEMEDYESVAGVWSPICEQRIDPTPTPTASTSSPSPAATPDALAIINGHVVTEASNCTRALFGAKFVEPHKIKLADRTCILFTFHDLAVQLEGNFVLRYRFFDIFSRPIGASSARVQAECYGGPFKIYPTKDAPPLKVSTPLTMSLHRQGVRVNVRPIARKSRKRKRPGDEGQLETIAPSPGSGGSWSNEELNVDSEEPLVLLDGVPLARVSHNNTYPFYNVEDNPSGAVIP